MRSNDNRNNHFDGHRCHWATARQAIARRERNDRPNVGCAHCLRCRFYAEIRATHCSGSGRRPSSTKHSTAAGTNFPHIWVLCGCVYCLAWIALCSGIQTRQRIHGASALSLVSTEIHNRFWQCHLGAAISCRRD